MRLDKEDNMTIDGAILTVDSHGDKFQCNKQCDDECCNEVQHEVQQYDVLQRQNCDILQYALSA